MMIVERLKMLRFVLIYVDLSAPLYGNALIHNSKFNIKLLHKYGQFQGINKRFQRLESHVVTLARSVAHLSSEMRSQHLVTQELEKLRDEFAAIR